MQKQRSITKNVLEALAIAGAVVVGFTLMVVIAFRPQAAQVAEDREREVCQAYLASHGDSAWEIAHREGNEYCLQYDEYYVSLQRQDAERAQRISAALQRNMNCYASCQEEWSSACDECRTAQEDPQRPND